MACSTFLDELYITRDAVLARMRNGQALVSISCRVKSWENEPPTKVLRDLREEIAIEERKQNAARGPARNVARVNR